MSQEIPRTIPPNLTFHFTMAILSPCFPHASFKMTSPAPTVGSGWASWVSFSCILMFDVSRSPCFSMVLLMYFNDFSQQVFHVLDLHIFLFMCKQNLPRFMACLSLHEHTVGPSGAPWMGKWVEHQARFEVFNGAYEYMHS